MEVCWGNAIKMREYSPKGRLRRNYLETKQIKRKYKIQEIFMVLVKIYFQKKEIQKGVKNTRIGFFKSIITFKKPE
jgi:hypothetical protein